MQQKNLNLNVYATAHLSGDVANAVTLLKRMTRPASRKHKAGLLIPSADLAACQVRTCLEPLAGGRHSLGTVHAAGMRWVPRGVAQSGCRLDWRVDCSGWCGSAWPQGVTDRCVSLGGDKVRILVQPPLQGLAS